MEVKNLYQLQMADFINELHISFIAKNKSLDNKSTSKGNNYTIRRKQHS